MTSSLHAPGLVLIATLVLLLAPSALGESAVDWDQAEAVPLVEGLQLPANLDVAPNGTIWYAEKGGNVSSLDPASGETALQYQPEGVLTGGERGLVGMALADDFPDTGAFYLYYTTQETQENGTSQGADGNQTTQDANGNATVGEVNRLVRVVDGEETVLARVPAAEQHNGGRILVTPDGTLFVGTGENLERDPAQDPGSLLGKILRLTPDGEPVQGNLDGLVFSMGHRNVYGLAYNEETEQVWATENSGWRRDEINVLEAGENYGYPECEGYHLNGVDDPCPTDKGYTFPIATFYEDRAAAPTGAVFWMGDFYWASLNEASIHQLTVDPETGEWNDSIVFEHESPILALDVGPEGRFYVAATDGILRLDVPEGQGDPAGNETGDPMEGDGDQPGDMNGSDGAGEPATDARDAMLAPSVVAAIASLTAAAGLARTRRSR